MSRLPPLTGCLNCATPLQGGWRHRGSQRAEPNQLLLTLSVLASRLNGAVGSLILLAIPVHLFLHLRGVYGTGRLATLLCMALLAAGSMVGVVLLALSLAAVGLLLNGG